MPDSPILCQSGRYACILELGKKRKHRLCATGELPHEPQGLDTRAMVSLVARQKVFVRPLSRGYLWHVMVDLSLYIIRYILTANSTLDW